MLNKDFHKIFLLLFPVIFFVLSAKGQNAGARSYIDGKRMETAPDDKDALAKSREFLRLDSTYYVGWMYEGIYKYNRSVDYMGFKNAIPSLRRAFDVLTTENRKTFQTLFDNVENLMSNFSLYHDLFTIFTALKESYDNVEMPEESMNLINTVASFQFKNDYGFELAAQRAWLYHRNRFLTPKEAPFLKNSVSENEQLAFEWCYRGIAFVKQYEWENNALFGSGQTEDRLMSIYHNLALLHCYNKNYDSSYYYYIQLANAGRVSWNNFGGMEAEVGNFAIATDYFNRDKFNNYQNFLKEPYYYLPELLIYANQTKPAILLVKNIIRESGSVPGFGWYNIALARSYLYDGQLDSAEIALNKAANFKELHIGTTLTQSQYEFSVQLLKLQLTDKKISREKFLNKGWWYSPKSLYRILILKVQKLMNEYVVANQLSSNPERNRLVYDLFCAESTTTFDEAWYILKEFSPKYFEKKYADYQKTDHRPNIQRYFRLFEYKFQLEEGDKKEATKNLQQLNRDILLDTAREKLFLGRLYESLSLATAGKNAADRDFYYNALLESYPQLVPFSGLKFPVRLTLSGVDDAMTRKVIDGLHACNIDFENTPGAASVNIHFNKDHDRYQAIINVVSASGKVVVDKMPLVFTRSEGAGAELALRIFGKGGATVL